MVEKMNSNELLKKIQSMFQETGISELADAEWIMCEILNIKRSFIPFYGEISTENVQKIMDAVSKRLKFVPLAYIFGKTDFMGYNFKVSKDTLIPRLDTEVLIEKVLKEIKEKQAQRVLDIGTGSGAIAIVLAKESNAKVVAVDVSEGALEIARENAKENHADVQFIKSDVFSNLKGEKFDFIVSNPPYIETAVIDTLSNEVKNNEPILALDGGSDGLYFYRRIVEESPNYLNHQGMLFFEIGYDQGEKVKGLMKEKFKKIEVIKDWEDNDRVVCGELKWLKD